MSDKDIHVKLDELLSANPDISPSERVIHLQDLGNCLPKSYVHGLEQKLYNVLKVYLHSKNFELQKCALNLLHTCLQNQNLATLSDALSLNLAFAVIFICNNIKDDLPEYQELWLKAFDTLQLMSKLYPVLCKNHGTRLLSVFQKALSVTYTSSVQKLKALDMLDSYISSVDIQNVKELLYHLCSEQLFPLAFSNYNENFHGLCLQVIYRLLPITKQVLIKYPEEWEKIFSDIRSKYVPAIDSLISENNCIFAKLWIFLIKLIGSKFHKGSPVVNSLLSCIEVAFKVPNLEVRKQSFICWQVLIEGFSVESGELYTEKRIKLLAIPLKTNNGKTEELIKTKVIVWGKLLELLYKNDLIGAYGILDEYLGFCFGPLNGTPLLYNRDNAHTLISQGKKYQSVHLTTCKSLVQLIGIRKYIDSELESNLDVLNFKGPAVKTAVFIEYSKSIIDSVGESCVMLSQLDSSDLSERKSINYALWKSLFFIIDTLDNQDAKTRIINEISSTILLLINIARRKTMVINFGLKPLFSIIASNEFGFCQGEQFANSLFIPMIEVLLKREKILLHEDVITILKSVFVFKRSSEQYLVFINNAKNVLKENVANPEKVNVFRSIWCIIEEEMLIFDKKNCDDKLYFDVLHDLLNWPIVTLKSSKSTVKIDLKWRDLYSFFCNTTSGLLKSKLSCMLMRSIYDLVKGAPNNITLAEYAYYIISNMNLDNCDEETSQEISEIYSTMKNIISSPAQPPEVVNIYESCVSHMLDTSSKFPKLHCLLPSINCCLTSLLDIHTKTGILRPATLFYEQIDKNDDKLKQERENLMRILDKHKDKMDNKICSVEVDTNLEKSEKEQTLILLGHDINTMTPVKLKGSMLKDASEKEPPLMEKSPRNKSDPNSAEVVFVNSPYKFDPKKLTKQQRERLSRRRDDIPALYQDLTQSSSQMNDFNSSNSESLPQLQTKENASTDNKTETNALDEHLTNEPYSEDIIQSDSEPTEKNTRVKRQRRSLNLTGKKEAEATVEEKRRRIRKRQYSIDTVHTSPNGTSKENMDVNKIQPESGEDGKSTRRRRLSKLQKPPKGNATETIECVAENESNSSDAISSTSENSQPPAAADDADHLPIKLKIASKNKRKSRVISPAASAEAKRAHLEEDETKTDANKESTSDDEKQASESSEETTSSMALEANTSQLNKVENVPPLYLGQPAKIIRGARRVSEGNLNKKPLPEKNIIDYANLFVFTNENVHDDKVKKKMIRELKNIQIDIKNSDEYLKTNGRKTRLGQCQQNEKEVHMLRLRRGRAVPKASSIKVEPAFNSESEESDVIESSQENEKQVNLKECEVRALYSLEKITSDSFLQESEPSNRPKISPIKINIKSNTLVKSDAPKTRCENIEDKSSGASADKSESETLIADKLASQTASVATETESLSSQVAPCDTPTEDICEQRKVILSNSVLSTEAEGEEGLPSTPPKLPNANNLATSPVSNDTPTRNKELLEDTLEISPIKQLPVAADVDVGGVPEDNETPELFECESVSQKTDDPGADKDKVAGNSSLYTNRTLRKNKSRVLSGRSAKMMKMISAKQTFVPTTSAATKTSASNKMDAYCSPSSNRTKKMMNNLERNDVAPDVELPSTPQPSTSSEPLINLDDVLCIGKELPSPFALPSSSILKRKRNAPEETAEEAIVPLVKKRRVNFSDPPVSCLKFIEKIIKPAACFSKHLPKELRTTRASTAEELEIESEMSAEQESHSLSDIVPIEDVEEPEEPTDTTLTSKVYDNTKPICEALVNDKEPISKIIAKLANSLDFVEPLATVLKNKSIETIGDLAKFTESQVHTIPLKVETVKSVLTEYHESLKEDTPVKEKRKITPVILSSPEKVSATSTCEVSVIIQNKDVISETQSANPTAEETTQASTSGDRDFSEKLFSSESEKIETPTVSKFKTVSQENLFSSPVNRIIVKTEFESPTSAKDNILNEEYCNIRVAKFIQFIRNSFVQKKFDPRPVIAALFANNGDILTHMNCWEDLIKYIVRDVGIWTLTKYLCTLKNIPALMIESILKNSLNEIGNDFICERLNKHEIIKFLAKEYNLITLLQEYAPQAVYSTFFDLANDTQYSHLKYKEMLQELYACVFQPHIEICHLLYKLDVDNVGAAVIKRMSAPNDMDTFLEQVCKNVPLEVYLKPTKKRTPKETKETSSELVTSMVQSIDNNQLSKDEELMILRSIAKKWSALEFFQTFSQHTKQN